MQHPTITRCKEHRKFASQKEADAELGKVALWGLRRGGNTWRLLKVFPCGDHWHIGRDWALRSTLPEEKPSTISSAARRGTS
jgi:hypothetical protein